jgi:hypothetical protein
MEIMNLVLEEMKSRGAYLYDLYSPPYVCSFAAHCFNLLNHRNEIYWESKRIPNMRLHLMFIAPPGFMKSYFMNNMGADPTSGIFANTKIKVGVEQSVTEAGLIGTFIRVDDSPVETDGSARIYKDGVMIIDEFSAMTNASKTTYNNQLDTQLLAALDHGRVRKRLGSGFIEYQTNFTIWGGVQPARYDFTSGMGRRFYFLAFLPTKQDDEILREVKERTRNIRVDKNEMSKLWGRIDHWIDSMEVIKRLEFDDSVGKMYSKIGVYSYDTQVMDRIIVGYHLATYGAEERMVVGVHDKELIDLLRREKQWRDDIHTGLPLVHLKK